ncbi:MAG TPA: Rieske 2Fe-2S domain-containing protein [Acidimicrobiales bacterium]|nr:Rieske 2Fe-2S domain-containing protein [Acidimicrobiales bacterium]
MTHEPSVSGLPGAWDDAPDAPVSPALGHHSEHVVALPAVMTGTHGAEEGAGAGTPWPDDVPPDQDDTWFPLRDDPWRARRMEYLIAAFFAVTGACGIGIMVAYVDGAQTQWEGSFFALATLCLGIGLVLWARWLLPGHDIVASRGHHTSGPEERALVVASLSRGADAMLTRRGFLAKKVLLPVGGIFGVALIWPLASLGVRPGLSLFHTKWYAGCHLVTEDGTWVHVDDVMVDGLLTVYPEGNIEDAASPAVLLNIGGAAMQARPGQAGFEVKSAGNGLVCFSKICSHAGCAVSLFNVLSMQLICPCHQSTFNILQDCKPVFGPAPRPLPQLPLGVDTNGYLISVSDFVEPIGPGFFDRSDWKPSDG